jgi:hypothetical protein
MDRVHIEYADQNESFRTNLPRRGTITHILYDPSTGKPWTLITLDEPRKP